MRDFEFQAVDMKGKIMKIQILLLVIGFVGFSATAGGVLPLFIENNQSKEELVTIENELRFATKLHAEYTKNIAVEYESSKNFREASKKAYVQALDTFGLLEERQKLETHFRVLLEYSDSHETKVVAMKSLLIAGPLEEESLRAIERAAIQKNIEKDMVYLIFSKRDQIIAERPINFPLAGKQKYFDILSEYISSGESATRGNAYELFKIGREIINDRSANDTGKIVTDMVKAYSGMPKEDQLKLAMSFIDIVMEEKVKKKHDYLIVDEILRVASGIKQDEHYKNKQSLLFELTYVAVADGFSEISINSMKSMLLKSEDRDITGLLLVPLFKVDDSDIEEKGYNPAQGI